MYLYICICIFLFVYLYLYICICIFVSVYLYLYICIFVFVYLYLYICICIFVFVCLYLYTCICIFVYSGCGRVVQGAGHKVKRLVLQRINGVSSNPVEERTSICLLGLIFEVVIRLKSSYFSICKAYVWHNYSKWLIYS